MKAEEENKQSSEEIKAQNEAVKKFLADDAARRVEEEKDITTISMLPTPHIETPRESMIREIMSYHRPTPEMMPKFEAVREAAIALVMAIDEHCPASADRTAAVRQVQDSLMTANRSIANNGAGYR